jgi:hypothetical protein
VVFLHLNKNEMALFKEGFNLSGLNEYWYVIAVLIIYMVRYFYKKNHMIKYHNLNALENLIAYLDKPKEAQETIVKELLLQNCFGKIITSNEYDFFSSLPSPLKNIRSYLSCKHYFSYDMNENKISLKNKKLNFRIVFWMTSYIISLLVCIGILIIGRESIGFSMIMYSISFLLFGIISLIESVTASTAKKLSSDLNI